MHIHLFNKDVVYFFPSVLKVLEMSCQSLTCWCWSRWVWVGCSSFLSQEFTMMTLVHKTIRLTIEPRRCKEEVKTRKITAKLALRKYVEIKCQHVMVVKCRWRLSWLTAFWDNGLLRHICQFCSPYVAFLCSDSAYGTMCICMCAVYVSEFIILKGSSDLPCEI